MSSNVARWVVIAAVALVGAVLIGDLLLIGLIPILVIAAGVGVVHVVGRTGEGTFQDTEQQVRRHLLEGDADAAARLLVPLLNARTPGTRRYAAETLTIAVVAGADDAAVLDALPRLTDLAPTFRIGRALIVRSRIEAALDVLEDEADGHDPVAWAEYVGALAAAGRVDEMETAVAASTAVPPIEAVLLAVRRLDVGPARSVRDALATRLGEDSLAVMVLDAGLPEPETRLAAFLEAHQTNPNPDITAWAAWAGAVLGSPVAREHLERIVGRTASGRTAVAIMLASLHARRPDIALRIAPTALRSARADVRAALHLAQARALAATDRPEEAIAALHFVPSEMALVAVVTPPLRERLRSAEGWPALAARIEAG